jgi:hypothetical protein
VSENSVFEEDEDRLTLSRATSIPGKLFERFALGSRGSGGYDIFLSRLNELYNEGPLDGKTVLAVPFSPDRPGSYDLNRAIRITEAELLDLDRDIWIAVRIAPVEGGQ